MRRRLILAGLFCAAAALAAAADAAPQPAPGPVVTVSAGALRGTASPGGGAIFRGVPYAQPPLGALRWRPPVRPKPWRGVRDATSAGPPCLQRDYGWNSADAAKGREDCLYLNVSTPRLDPNARLPVMFWIHGGANWAGSGSGYIASPIVKQGVVLVTINYRLDVFGFLSLPALTAESPRHASGNYALMDQIAALQWVKRNIARFGGDPAKVTIFGQSAGAEDVGYLTLSPQARGLFVRAIEESGTPGFGLPPRSLHANEAIGQQLLAKFGLGLDAKGLLDLRSLPGPEVLGAAAHLKAPTPDQSFSWLSPVVDGWVLPRTPLELLKSPDTPRIPSIIGTNARELPLYGADDIPRRIRQMFGVNADRALKLYEAPPTPEVALMGSLSDRIAADVMFRCPAELVAHLREAHGAPVWRYQLSVANRASYKPVVEHSSELPFVFDPPPPGETQTTWPPLQLYWTNFAKTGDPNGPGLPPWPRYGAAAAYIDFTPAGAQTKFRLRAPVCALLTRP